MKIEVIKYIKSVENIILRSTAKNPKNRFESVKEMNESLKNCLSEEHVNDKKYVYEYPENDLDDTKVISNNKPKTVYPITCTLL